VDAFDRAGLGALEAGLALERAVLVVQQLEAAAELGRDVGRLLGPANGRLGREEALEGEPHAAHEAHARDGAHAGPLRMSTTAMAAAVRNRLSSDAGSSHFQAKPISWSIRTRGSVPRSQTKVKTSVNVLPRNQNRPATQSKLMYAHSPTSPPTTTLNR